MVTGMSFACAASHRWNINLPIKKKVVPTEKNFLKLVHLFLKDVTKCPPWNVTGAALVKVNVEVYVNKGSAILRRGTDDKAWLCLLPATCHVQCYWHQPKSYTGYQRCMCKIFSSQNTLNLKIFHLGQDMNNGFSEAFFSFVCFYTEVTFIHTPQKVQYWIATKTKRNIQVSFEKFWNFFQVWGLIWSQGKL